MDSTCLRVSASGLLQQETSTSWVRVYVLYVWWQQSQHPSWGQGWEEVGTRLLQRPGTLLKGPRRKGGGRSAPDAYRGLDQEGGVQAWVSGPGRGWRAAPSGCNGGLWGGGRGEVDKGLGATRPPLPPRSARCLPSRYFLRSRRWTLFTTPESFSCSSFRSCSRGGGVLRGPAPCPRAALRPPAPGSISLPPPPLGPPRTPAWRRRWGRRRQQRRQQREEAAEAERRPWRWTLAQTPKLIGELWRAGRKRKRPRTNGQRALGAHPLVWEGEQLEEAGLAGYVVEAVALGQTLLSFPRRSWDPVRRRCGEATGDALWATRLRVWVCLGWILFSRPALSHFSAITLPASYILAWCDQGPLPELPLHLVSCRFPLAA